MPRAGGVAAIDRGLAWLAKVQEPTGEFPAVASSLVNGPPSWKPDSLKFVTALVVLALDPVPDPRIGLMVDRAVGFLRSERERSDQWRYWARANELFAYTPPDADDTACCSMAVATRGDTTRANVAVLLANRDPHGRFYTWLIPHNRPLDPRYWWAMRDELRPSTRRYRQELWANSEAVPEDVDGVVNANVVRYLGPERAPGAAVDWVASIIADGLEDDCDSWHRNRFTLYQSVADAAFRGIGAFKELASTIVGRIGERVDGEGTVGPPIDSAMALLAIRRLGGQPSLATRLADGLLARQLSDGSWAQSVFYFGGPAEQFGWASAALSTATAVAALTAD